MKKRISISVDKHLVRWLDDMCENRSGFIQALLEGARAGFKTILVPQGYQPTHATLPPPIPDANEAEKRKDPEAERKAILEAEFAAAGKKGMEAGKKKRALTPEQIAFQGAKEGITNEMTNLFAKHRITADMASGDIKAVREEMFKILNAD